MTYDTRAVDFFLGENTAFVRDESQEVEISFLLQNARPDDPRILTLLVERYGSEILGLVQALLDLPPGERSGRVAAQVFATAGASIQGFWGESGPRKWLFGLAIHLYWDFLRHPEKSPPTSSAKSSEFESSSGAPEPGSELEASLWEAIDGLPERLRLVLVLRYLFGLSLQDIADLLNENPDQVDFELFSVRSRLHAFFPPGDRLYFNVHPDRFRQIDDYRIGLIDHETAVQIGLVQHVSGCEHCFAYADDLVVCEETMVSALRRRWPLAPLAPSVRASLEEAARSVSSQPHHRQVSALPVRQLLWTGGILLAFAGLAWYLFQAALDQEGRFVNAETLARQVERREPTHLSGVPEPLEVSAVKLTKSGDDGMGGTAQPYIYHMDTFLSGDGAWAAFSSTGTFLPDDTRADSMDVYIFDLSNGSIERIAAGDNPFPRWRMSPGLSENGRWIVYTSNEMEGSDQGYYDYSRTGISLYDRETGGIERIDIPVNGRSPDGGSYAPVISPDGRWVAFWSTSSNLVSEGEEACTPQSEEPQPCLDVFVHDRESSVTKRVPVGRFDFFLFQTDRLKISADGRWIPLTLYKDDRIAAEIGLEHTAGAYLYDLQADEFIRVDLSSDGIPGDAISYAASISADGRFVAFISRANNLVPGDTRRAADVYVRDLVTGETERVTGTREGILGFEYPNGSYYTDTGWGNMVSLSADGRLVAFLGRRENRPGDLPGGCPSSVTGIDLCNGVFVYDRETGKFEEVTVPEANHLYLFPNLSADGRRVAYLEMMPTCDSSADRPVCTEIWLYDRKDRWTYPVTKGRYRLPEAAQLPVNNLSTGSGPVTSLAFSPDGEILATGIRNDTVRLWRSANGGPLGTMKSSNGKAVNGLAFSPDGELLAGGLSDGRVEVWRISDRYSLYTLDGHPGAIQQIAFFSDGRLLARTAKETWIWQLRADVFQRVIRFEHTPGTIWSMAVSPERDWIATAENDDLVWLRQATSGEVLMRLQGHAEGLRKVAISPDGKYLAVVLKYGLIDVWEIESGEEGKVSAAYLRTLSHPEDVLNLAFVPDSSSLATVSGAGDLILWNVESGASRRPLFPYYGYNGVLAFSQDRIAAGILSGMEPGEVYLAYLWKGFNDRIKPSFFEIGETDGDLPTGSLPSYRTRVPGQGYTYIGKEMIYKNLYQANGATPFEIQAPEYLPPGFQFRLAQVYPTGAVSIHYDYYERPGEQPTATLVVLQHQDSPGFPGFTVGASAHIQEVEVAAMPGEYVRGEWQSFTLGENDQGRFAWHWDSQSASQHLRWKDGEQLYALHYRPLQTGGIEERYISKSDMLDIAGRMEPLDEPPLPRYLRSASIVRDEHGCAVSAPGVEPDGSPGPDGAHAPGKCQLFLGDQEVQGDSLPFAKTDLDCDGQAEQVVIRVLPGLADAPPAFQLVLMAPAFTGRYHPAWYTAIPDTGPELHAWAEVRSSGICEGSLMLETTSLGETQTQVFRWDGVEIRPAGESEGLFDTGHDALPP